MVVRTCGLTCVFVHTYQQLHLIRVAEHLGSSSRRPRHPFPALMAGEPQAVYLCTRP